ncbi:MAG: glycosyltransferase [Chloroflexota bacterium]|nr:glycosyltransferase [Chloroflexota bacterium]
MQLTVAICTWNRCDLLRQTLARMTELVVPGGVDWELLVVNNNSSDATDEVIASFAGRLPVRRLFEARPGKSNALNLAAREARGTYILWTDDDVLVDSQWIAEYHRAFLHWPDASIFGGAIDPWFAGTPPRWLQQALPRVGNVYATRDLGGEPLPLSDECLPYGANMAVRRADQLRYLYDPSLGPRPESVFGGEETKVLRAMLADGATGWYVPRARVRHYIAEHRQTTRYLRRYFLGYGEACARPAGERSELTVLGRPLWLWKQVVTEETRYRVRRLTSEPDVWIEDLISSSLSWGQFRAFASGGVRQAG